ncbi:C4-dicarboxylate transporter/malic acid transport protein [Cordyceps fumosorosea ARSEF 2679]|uniref:Sulfite efflux pump SSU1 n=1 Tax=Cordyceps fumosorosea (strain ARSEF 2679) TaxID=1081104 RepID=A0A167UA81_CORFA|nr:C4-dicarboxylate transporter/malic acid transport protein [Cordyceps fumosorosea ARSEF 2679]OAA61376.1 C4-dicarboxylate transporter/malic acid transport protein [Cordyceps fumosorosea ARSEF 2679]
MSSSSTVAATGGDGANGSIATCTNSNSNSKMSPQQPAPSGSACANEAARRPPCKNTRGWRKIVRNFTPSWFAVNMGTGIVSILLHNLPYNAQWLQYISYAIFALNVVLFTTFLAISILRYTLYPEIWTAMIDHPGQSLFLGCFPMGFATIINMMIFACGHWGSGLIHLAWAFWWLDALLSMATCISMPFIVMHWHRPGLEHTTAALLLPIVPTIVAAATGGIVAEALPSPDRALTTLVASYVLWGIGEALSACVLALYFHRLTVHDLPPREVIVSVFLPVGPLGQGGFGIQQLGRVALARLPQTTAFSIGLDPARAAEVLYVLGVFLALVMWGFALLWVCFALISLATTAHFPFNMGWWGFTFPLGVWGTCTAALAMNLDSDFFKIATMIISLTVLLLWLMVGARTLQLAISGDMFVAPCLKTLREKDAAPASQTETEN